MVGIRDVPGLGVEAAVVKIVWMMEEREQLLDEKDRARFFLASTASLTNGSF